MDLIRDMHCQCKTTFHWHPMKICNFATSPHFCNDIWKIVVWLCHGKMVVCIGCQCKTVLQWQCMLIRLWLFKIDIWLWVVWQTKTTIVHLICHCSFLKLLFSLRIIFICIWMDLLCKLQNMEEMRNKKKI